MKNIPKSDRLEYFAPWVNSEKTQYSVEGNFDIKSKKVCKYSLLNGPRKPYLFEIIKYKLCNLVWLFGGLQYKVYWKEIRSYCRIKSTSWRIITIKIRRLESNHNDPAIRVRCTCPYRGPNLGEIHWFEHSMCLQYPAHEITKSWNPPIVNISTVFIISKSILTQILSVCFWEYGCWCRSNSSDNNSIIDLWCQKTRIASRNRSWIQYRTLIRII